jgi:ferredoxin
MRKGVIVVLIAAVALVFVSAVYAYPLGNGNGICRSVNVDTEAVKKFQKETLSFRDELITRKLDLRKEFSKRTPDRDRIAALQKEIIDIRTKIMKKADESGVPKYFGCAKGCRWMQGKGIMQKSRNRMVI